MSNRGISRSEAMLEELIPLDGTLRYIRDWLEGFPAEKALFVVFDDWDASRPQRLYQEAIALRG